MIRILFTPCVISSAQDILINSIVNWQCWRVASHIEANLMNHKLWSKSTMISLKNQKFARFFFLLLASSSLDYAKMFVLIKNSLFRGVIEINCTTRLNVLYTMCRYVLMIETNRKNWFSSIAVSCFFLLLFFVVALLLIIPFERGAETQW